MKISKGFLIAGLLTVGSLTRLFGHEHGEALNDQQKAFLRSYENVRAALAADDLGAAKTAASAIKEDENAEALARSASLADAREVFKKLSKRAVHLASDHEGYFIANCQMVKNGEGNWVQTSGKVSNPYFGKSMLTCGSIKPAMAEQKEKPAEHHHHE